MPEIPGYPNGSKPKRATKAARLKAAGISEDQLALYMSCFTEKRRYSPHIVRDTFPTATWSTQHRSFHERDILMHLTQEHILGLRWFDYVNCIVFDIDNHSSTNTNYFTYHPANERLESIIKAFNGAKPLII